jgi:hypothetical protein
MGSNVAQHLKDLAGALKSLQVFRTQRTKGSLSWHRGDSKEMSATLTEMAT